MEQHAVPQNISSYEFKLVGDMTLKQFFQLAGGIVVSLIFYAAPLPGFIKWPFIILFALLGVALAFLPLQERPLSTWFFAFIKAVYSPTQYTWAEGGAEGIFSKSTPEQIPVVVVPQKVPQARVLEAFEAGEKNFFGKVASLFQTTTAPILTAPLGPAAEQVLPIPKPPMTIPPAPPIRVEPIGISEQVNIPPTPLPTQQPIYQPQPVAPVLAPAGQRPLGSAPATFAPQSAPVAPSEQPNTVVGQVLTSEGKIVEGAILEIRDSDARPVRALKTNKVGHFLSVTPLRDGTYEIETEKDGLTFDKITFTASGLIIPPIEIRARSAGQLAN